MFHVDNDAREKLHSTAALNCLLCGEDKAQRIADNIARILDELRSCEHALRNVVKHPEFAHIENDYLNARDLLHYLDTGEGMP